MIYRTMKTFSYLKVDQKAIQFPFARSSVKVLTASVKDGAD